MTSTSKRKIIVRLFVSLAIVVAISSWYIYRVVSSGFDIKTPVYVYVNENHDYNKLLNDIESEGKIKHIDTFKKLASYYHYPQNMRTGRYIIKPQMTVLQFIRELRSGHQSPVYLTFNNIRTKADLTQRLTQQLMLEDTTLLSTLNDSTTCTQLGFTPQTVVAMFIPNTYEIYWNTPQANFLKRMETEYSRFWTKERLAKAAKLNLTPVQVSTLASIVEEECRYTDEYPMVAGLYLNRLKKGMLLQADPTVKFAVGDFTLKRILDKHIAVDSPYNTYKHIGLPPGPIRVPSIVGIDAVLNPATHNYYYMCAKEDFSGRHNFATTYSEHLKNAARYQQALNKNKIY